MATKWHVRVSGSITQTICGYEVDSNLVLAKKRFISLPLGCRCKKCESIIKRKQRKD